MNFARSADSFFEELKLEVKNSKLVACYIVCSSNPEVLSQKFWLRDL